MHKIARESRLPSACSTMNYFYALGFGYNVDRKVNFLSASFPDQTPPTTKLTLQSSITLVFKLNPILVLTSTPGTPLSCSKLDPMAKYLPSPENARHEISLTNPVYCFIRVLATWSQIETVLSDPPEAKVLWLSASGSRGKSASCSNSCARQVLTWDDKRSN